jgi:hypothetical protein
MGPYGPALALACRIVLALVLALAAVAKINDRAALPGRLRAMGVAPSWSQPIAIGLPVAELAVAVALGLAYHASWPAVAAFVLVAAFTVFLVATARRAVPCPCFGTVRTARVTSLPAAVLRNGVLLALAVLATGSVDGARAGSTVVVAAIVAAGASVAVGRVA